MDKQYTAEGTEFKAMGRSIIFPADHEFGGGVMIKDEAVDKILASPDAGEIPHELTWEATGEVRDTRAGPSKVLRISQTSFDRTRTVEVTLVDVADANLDAAQKLS